MYYWGGNEKRITNSFSYHFLFILIFNYFILCLKTKGNQNKHDLFSIAQTETIRALFKADIPSIQGSIETFQWVSEIQRLHRNTMNNEPI